MPRRKKWLIFFIIVLILVGIGFILSNRKTLEFIVNVFWFHSKGLLLYYLRRLLYPYAVFIGVTLLFFGIFFVNFWAASRFLGTVGPKDAKASDRRRYHDLVRMVRTGSMKFYTPLSMLLAIPVAIPLYRKWEQALLYIFAPPSGMIDPAFGLDASFYIFSLPIYTLVIRELLLVFALLFVFLAIMYWFENRLLTQADLKIPTGARTHLTIIVLVVLGLQILRYALEMFGLLYVNDPTNIFFGPGFVQWWFHMPLIFAKILFFGLASLFMILLIHRHRGLKPFIACALLFGLAMGLQQTSYIPNMISQYIVRPNEMERQKPFIENNIQATLDAFQLRDIEYRDYRVQPVMSLIPEDINLQRILANIPVWDRELLDQVYEQRQAIRPYYSFTGVDVDRYTVNDVYQQVNLSAREINVRQLPAAAQSWINERFQYTHGYGVVMSPAAQRGDEDMEWFVRDVPLLSSLPYAIEEPAIYFGMEKYRYAIAPNEEGEIQYPDRDKNVVANYRGRGGAPLSNVALKALFALYFKDTDLFFTTNTNNQSRILFRRNIQEAIRIIAPFLHLDEDPYIVAGPKGLFWIQDAYTTSNCFPYVAFYEGQEYGKAPFNYIRNSVKIVFDAYHGDVAFYIFDPTDPIIRAYERIYPELFRSRSQMPEFVRAHVRYPKSFFEIQMSVYAKYHQIDPELFYRQEDHWQFAGVETMFKRSYYMTLNLINLDQFEFLLLTAMTPISRPNLRTLIAAGCDGDNYGRIIVYNFPKGQQVYGPAQVSSLIDNDTTIAQELTLWDQAGSKIKRGRMIIFPVSGSVLYIQPIYLVSTAETQIPELIRLIISQGTVVEMDKTLQGGLEKLVAKLASRTPSERQQAYPSIQTPPPADQYRLEGPSINTPPTEIPAEDAQEAPVATAEEAATEAAGTAGEPPDAEIPEAEIPEAEIPNAAEMPELPADAPADAQVPLEAPVPPESSELPLEEPAVEEPRG